MLAEIILPGEGMEKVRHPQIPLPSIRETLAHFVYGYNYLHNTLLLMYCRNLALSTYLAARLTVFYSCLGVGAASSPAIAVA